MDGSLMAEKAASPKKKLVAMGLAAVIVIIVVGLLSFTTYELEQHYHLFHPAAPADATKNADVARGPLLMIVLILAYPLLSVLGMALVIPLLIYVNDHAAFNGLNLLQPSHFGLLLKRVYGTWLSTTDGKLNGKDL